MKEKDRIRDIAYESESLCTDLDDLQNAMQIFYESLENELPGSKIEEWQAICFTRRYPLYLGTFRVICRELERIVGVTQSQHRFDVYRSRGREGALFITAE